MAFNINAQIILSQPKNLNNVTKQISKKLGKVTKIDLKIGNVAQLTTLNKQLTALNNSLSKLNSGLSSTRGSVSSLGKSFNNTASGVNNAAKAQGTLNSQVIRSNQALKNQAGLVGTLGKRFGSVAKQAIAFGAISRPIYDLQRALTGAVKDAVEFEKEIVRISQVTGKSIQQLQGLTEQINKLATSLGISANELAETSRVISQAGIRGRDLEQVLTALARSTLAPTFGKITDTTEGLIAAFGQFGLKGKDAEAVLGSLNKTSKEFAVEAEDLISVIRRAGGVFSQAAGDTKGTIGALQELTSVFTAVRSSTRESADTIAAGLRTIFSRIQRKSTINFLKQFGVDLVDAQGKFVGIFPAFDKLSQRLDTLINQGDALTLSAIAEELGGIRQIGKLLPAIAQFDKARKALTVAQQGAIEGLGGDVAKALDTIDNRVKRVSETFNQLIRTVFESDAFQNFAKGFLAGSQSIIDSASSIFKTIEPILPLLTTLGTIKLGRAIGGFLGGGGAVGALSGAASTLSGSATAQNTQKTAAAIVNQNSLINTTNSTLANMSRQLANLIQINSSGFNTLTSQAARGRSTVVTGFGGGRRRAAGGAIPKFADGGRVYGPSHAAGGVIAELEGGEYVIPKKYAPGGRVRRQIGGVKGVTGKTQIRNKTGENLGLSNDIFNVNVKSEFVPITSSQANEFYGTRGVAFENFLAKSGKYGQFQGQDRFPVDFIKAGKLYDAKYFVRNKKTGFDQTNQITNLDGYKKALNYYLYQTFKGQGYRYDTSGVNNLTVDGRSQKFLGKRITADQDSFNSASSLTFLFPDVIPDDEAKKGKGKKKKIGRRGRAAGGLIQKLATGDIVRANSVGVAILDPDDVADGKAKVSVKDIESQLGFSKGTQRGFSGVSKVFKGKNYSIIKQGLSKETSERFNKVLAEGLIKGVDFAASEISGDLGLGPTTIDQASKTNFIQSQRSALRGDLFEAALSSLNNRGKFDDAVDFARPFDFPDGLQGPFADNFSKLPSKFVDAKSSIAAAPDTNIRGKIIREIAADVVEQDPNILIQKNKQTGGKTSKKSPKQARGFGALTFSGGGEVPVRISDGEMVVTDPKEVAARKGELQRINKLSAGGFASGTIARGPGTGTSDSIYTTLPEGAFVVNAASTKKYLGLRGGGGVQRLQGGGQAAGGAAGAGIGLLFAVQGLTSSFGDADSAFSNFLNIVVSSGFAIQSFGSMLLAQAADVKGFGNKLNAVFKGLPGGPLGGALIGGVIGKVAGKIVADKLTGELKEIRGFRGSESQAQARQRAQIEGGATGGGAGALLGGAIGSSLGPLGTAIGVAVGGTAGAIIGKGVAEVNAPLKQATFESVKAFDNTVKSLDLSLQELEKGINASSLEKVNKDVIDTLNTYNASLTQIQNELVNELNIGTIVADLFSSIGLGSTIQAIESDFQVALTSAEKSKFLVSESIKKFGEVFTPEQLTSLRDKFGKGIEQLAQDLVKTGEFKSGQDFNTALDNAAASGNKTAQELIKLSDEIKKAAFAAELFTLSAGNKLDKATAQSAGNIGIDNLQTRFQQLRAGQRSSFITEDEKQQLRDQGFTEAQINQIATNLFNLGRNAQIAAEDLAKETKTRAAAAVVLRDFRVAINTFVSEVNKASKQLNFDIAKISGNLGNLEGRFEDALAGRRTTRLERLENPFTAGASFKDQQAALDKIGDVTGIDLSGAERALRINEIFESSLEEAVANISGAEDIGDLGEQLINNLERSLGATLPQALKDTIINQVEQAGGGEQGTATAAEIAKQLLESGEASKLLGEQFGVIADSSSNLVDVYNKVIAQIEKNIALETRLLDAKVENEKKFAEARIKDQAQLNRISGRRSDPFRDALVNRQERLSALGQGRAATATSVVADRSRLKAQFEAQQKALSADPTNDALKSSLAQTQSELNSNTQALTLLSNQTEALAALEAKAQRAGQNAADLRGGLKDILTAIKDGDVETVGAIVSQQVSVDKALRGVATIPEAFEAMNALDNPAIAALVNQITGSDFGASDLQARLQTQLGNIAAAQGGPVGRATSNFLNGILLANQRRLALAAEAKKIQEEQNQARSEIAKNTTDANVILKDIRANTDALGSKFGQAVLNFEKAVAKLLTPPVAAPPAPAGGGPLFPSTGGVIGNGMLTYRAAGGSIFKSRGTDTVPAMLTPGEYVVKKSAVDQYGPGVMQAINNGSAQVYASTGGKVGRGVIYRNGGGVVPGPDNNWNGYGSQKVYLQAEAGRERRRKEAEEKERVRQRREKQYNDLEAARKRREGDNYEPTPNPWSIKPIITDDERIQDDQPLSPRPIYNSAGGSGNDTPIEAAERAFGATPTKAGGIISEEFNKGISSSNPAYIPLISLDPNTSFSSAGGIGAQFDEQLGYKDRKDALGVLLKQALAVEKTINEKHGLNRNRMALANEAFNAGEIGKAALFLRKFYDEGRATSFVGAEVARREKKQADAKAAKERQERVNRFADERSSDVLKEQIGSIDVKERQFLEDAGDNLTELDRKQITAFRKQRSELSDALKLRESNDRKNEGLSTIVALKNLVTGGGFKGAAGGLKERGLFQQGADQQSASELFNDIYKAAEAAGISGDELRDDNAVNLLKRILGLPDKQFNKAIPYLGGFSLGDEAAKKEWASLRTSVLKARSGKGNPDLVAGDPTLKGPLGKGIDLLKGGIRAADELALGGLGGDAVDFIGGGQRVNRNVTSRSQAFASDFGSDVANITQEIFTVASAPSAVASVPSLVKGGAFAVTKLSSVVKSTKAASTAAENLPTFRAAAQQIKNGAESVKNSKAVQKFKDVKQSVSESTEGIRNGAKNLNDSLNELATKGITDRLTDSGELITTPGDQLKFFGGQGGKAQQAAKIEQKIADITKKMEDSQLGRNNVDAEGWSKLYDQRSKLKNKLGDLDGTNARKQAARQAEEARRAAAEKEAADLIAAKSVSKEDYEIGVFKAEARLDQANKAYTDYIARLGEFDPNTGRFKGGVGAGGPNDFTPSGGMAQVEKNSARFTNEIKAAQKALEDARNTPIKPGTQSLANKVEDVTKGKGAAAKGADGAAKGADDAAKVADDAAKGADAAADTAKLGAIKQLTAKWKKLSKREKFFALTTLGTGIVAPILGANIPQFLSSLDRDAEVGITDPSPTPPPEEGLKETGVSPAPAGRGPLVRTPDTSLEEQVQADINNLRGLGTRAIVDPQKLAEAKRAGINAANKPKKMPPFTGQPLGAGLPELDAAQVAADVRAERIASLDEELKRNKALRNFRDKYNSFILRGEASASKFGLDPSTNRFLAEADTYQQEQLDYLVGIGSITADTRQKVDAEIAAQKIDRGIGSKTSAAEAAGGDAKGSGEPGPTGQYRYQFKDGTALNRKQREQAERRFKQTGQVPPDVVRIPIMIQGPQALPFNKGGEVPIMAQTGEFVMNRQAVQRNGIGMLSRMNQGLPAFHGGGYVNGSTQYRQAGGRIFGRQNNAPSSVVTVNGSDAAKELNNAIITGGETVKQSWQTLFDTVAEGLNSALGQISTIPNQINTTIAPVQIEGVGSFTDALAAQIVPKIVEQIAPLIGDNTNGGTTEQGAGV